MELEINDIPDVNQYLNVPLPLPKKPVQRGSRPVNDNFVSEPVKPKISYDDILAKMHAKYFGQEVKIVEPIKKNQMFSSEEKASLKQSKIYNKYFREYLDEDDNQEEPPRTREEYLKRLELDRRRLEHVRKAKSTKMFYTHQPSSTPNVIRATPNNLRSMGHIFRKNMI